MYVHGGMRGKNMNRRTKSYVGRLAAAALLGVGIVIASAIPASSATYV